MRRSPSPRGILRTLGWMEAGIDFLRQISSLDEESRLGSSLAFSGSGEVSKLPGASGAIYKREPTLGAQPSKKSSEIALTVPITVPEDITYFEGDRECEPLCDSTFLVALGW